jgi:hypothetical protein
MFEPINSNGFSTDASCRWCDKALTRDEAQDTAGVCERCLQMLLDAGITDEEIFGGAKRYSGKKRSAGAKGTGRSNKPRLDLGTSK